MIILRNNASVNVSKIRPTSYKHLSKSHIKGTDLESSALAADLDGGRSVNVLAAIKHDEEVVLEHVVVALLLQR